MCSSLDQFGTTNLTREEPDASVALVRDCGGEGGNLLAYPANLIKFHKAQLASDRMSCHSATANQVRLVLHTAAFWLMHGARAAIPRTNPLASSEFATIRERLIKIGARVIEHIARIRVHLPTSCPETALFRTVAIGLLRSGP
jgi:Transposase DDE domain group 1